MSFQSFGLSFGVLAVFFFAARGEAAGKSQVRTIRPVYLRCEYRVNPRGIDEPRPRLSWILKPSSPEARGEKQTAYRILVASTRENLAADRGDVWDTGEVESSSSVHVVYSGPPLTSGQECWWKVRVRDAGGRWSPWSEPAFWSMGLLKAEEWHGKWIGLKTERPEEPSPLKDTNWIWFEEGKRGLAVPPGDRYFRRTFVLPEGRSIAKAVLFLTADNSFTLFVNGKRRGRGSGFNQLFRFDLRDQLHAGRNVLALAVTNAGATANPAGLIGILKVTFENGAPLVLVTDGEWKSAKTASGKWTEPDYDDSSWTRVRVLGKYGIKPWGEIAKPENRELPARYLRREFEVGKGLRRAVAYVSGLGLFELEINGRKVGDQVLSPALSQYDKRVFYVTFRVDDLLRPGRNALGVILGNGRYFAPRLNVPTKTVTFGFPKLLLELRLDYADGTSHIISTDESWKVTDRGPVRENNEYDGEIYDARLEMSGWSEPGFAAAGWRQAEELPAPGGVLRSQGAEPIRVIETLKPVTLTNPKPGVYIYDMGQNLVGWCRLKVRGPRGARVSVRHAERLTDEGTLYVDNLRSAKAMDVYILKGEGLEVYEPRFTYHGFRYVELRGYPGEPTLSSLEALVVHDDLQPAGSFSCSNRLLNRIHRNVRWGVRGNYRSIPTDCPQRDERQGWLGDRSAESRGEACFFDIAAFYSKWIDDIQDCQRPTGSVPDVAPSYWPLYNDNVTWPSSFIIIPGHIYEQYGDRRILARHFPAMKKWIDYMSGFMKDGIIAKDNYGDWCVPPEEPHLIHSRDPARRTPGDFLATAYFYHDIRLMGRYARILGRADEAAAFEKKAREIRAAFNTRFFHPQKGYYANGSQTSCVLPLAFGLVEEKDRERLFAQLVERIEKRSRGHIGTGLIGAQWLMQVLTEHGRVDLAYRIASQTDYPSWGYMIERGATTIWELWNGDTADPAMNSGNHVMLVGDLITWFYGDLAGIKTDYEHPGFERIIIRPRPVGDLTFVEAARDLKLEVTIPVGSEAVVYVPARSADRVTESGKSAGEAPGVTFLGFEKGYALYRVGSGHYSFVSAGYR